MKKLEDVMGGDPFPASATHYHSHSCTPIIVRFNLWLMLAFQIHKITPTLHNLTPNALHTYSYTLMMKPNSTPHTTLPFRWCHLHHILHLLIFKENYIQLLAPQSQVPSLQPGWSLKTFLQSFFQWDASANFREASLSSFYFNQSRKLCLHEFVVRTFVDIF